MITTTYGDRTVMVTTSWLARQLHMRSFYIALFVACQAAVTPNIQKYDTYDTV